MDLYKNNMLLNLKKPIKKYAIYVHDAIGGGYMLNRWIEGHILFILRIHNI